LEIEHRKNLKSSVGGIEIDLQIPIFLTNTKNLSIIIASLLAIGGITAVGVLNTNEETVIFSSNEDGFKNVIKADAQDIYNAVNNVLTGREDPETVKKMILTEYRGTERDSTFSAEEIEINTQYQAFLTEAYSVLEVYEAGQVPDLTKMNAAKAALS
jgi:hypothetical protein